MTRGKKKKKQRSRGTGPPGIVHRRSRLRQTAKVVESAPEPQFRTLTFPWILLVVLVSFAIRAVYLSVAGRMELFEPLILDSQVYADTAAMIARGHGAGDHPYVLSPLYPYLMAPFIDGAGQLSTRGFQLVQTVLGSLTAGLTAWIASRLAGRVAGVIAGLTVALFGPLIYYDGAILVASLQTFCITLALALLVFEESGGPSTEIEAEPGPTGPSPSLLRPVLCWLGAGVALGLSAALRPTGLAIVPPVIGMLWLGVLTFRKGRDRPAGAALRTCALLLGLALMVTPFTVRNIVHGGERVLLSANGGFNFWIGNNADADGRFPKLPGYDPETDPAARSFAVQALEREVSYKEASRWWSGRAFEDIRRDPPRWIRLLRDKVISFGTPHEIRQMMHDFDWYRDEVWVLRFPLDARVILLLAALSPFVAWLGGRPRALQRLRWPLVVLLSYTGAVVLFFITSRYRAPIIPTAIILGAFTVRGFWDLALAFRSAASKRVFILLAAILVLLPVSYALYDAPNAPYKMVFADWSEVWVRARLLAEQGKFGEAAPLFEQSLALSNESVVHYDYAVMLTQSGRHEESRTHLLESLRLNPDQDLAWLHLGELRLTQDRDLRGAREAFERAVEIKRDLEQAHFRLGQIYMELGEPALAAESMRAFLALAPPDSPLRPRIQEMLWIAEEELGETD